jgi:hypothetical protein
MAAFIAMPVTATSIMALAPGLILNVRSLLSATLPELLEEYFNKKNYKPVTISVIGQYGLLSAYRAQAGNYPQACWNCFAISKPGEHLSPKTI